MSRLKKIVISEISHVYSKLSTVEFRENYLFNIDLHHKVIIIIRKTSFPLLERRLDAAALH